MIETKLTLNTASLLSFQIHTNGLAMDYEQKSSWKMIVLSH